MCLYPILLPLFCCLFVCFLFVFRKRNLSINSLLISWLLLLLFLLLALKACWADSPNKMKNFVITILKCYVLCFRQRCFGARAIVSCWLCFREFPFHIELYTLCNQIHRRTRRFFYHFNHFDAHFILWYDCCCCCCRRVLGVLFLHLHIHLCFWQTLDMITTFDEKINNYVLLLYSVYVFTWF